MANIPVETPGANNSAFVAMAAAVAPRLVFARINMNNANFSASFRDDGTGKLGWYVGASGAVDGAQIKTVTIDPATGALTLSQHLDAPSIGPVGATPFAIKTNNIVRATFLSGGFLGLGTATPSQLLHLEGASPTMLINAVSGGAAITLSAVAGQSALTRFETAGFVRWQLGRDSTAEGGSNAGSDFSVYRYDDAGVLLGTSVLINRSTGIVTFPSGVTLPTNATATTQAPGTNDTTPATTAFTQAALSSLGGTLPIGTSIPYNQSGVPVNFLLEDGAAYNSVTYATLFNVLVRYSTVTLTIASPGVVNWAAHPLKVNDPIKFTTTGTLPTGLTVGTVYYVIAAGYGANSFRVSATAGGTAINFTGTQSGVHTGINAPHGCANDLSTFNVPESRGESIRAADMGRGIDTARGFGAAQLDALQNHAHNMQYSDFSGSTAGSDVARFSSSANLLANASTAGINNFIAGVRLASETRGRNVMKLFCIRYQ